MRSSRTSVVAVLGAVALVAPLVGPVEPRAATAADDHAGTDAADRTVEVTALTVEATTQPLGVDVDRPRFGWQLASTARGVQQQAYRIEVASSADALQAGEADVWDSGQVTSSDTSGVVYDGPQLGAGTRYHWRVVVVDDAAATWTSEPSWFETGVFDPDAWQADWIRHDTGDELVFGDVTVRTQLTRTTGDARAGVLLRADGPNDAYAWQIVPGPSLRKLRFDDGRLTTLGTVDVSDVVAGDGTDEPIELEVDVQGETFTTRIDGEVVDVHTDDTHTAGAVGFSLGTRHGLFQEAEYADLEVLADGEVVYADDFDSDRGDLTGGRIADGTLTLDGVATAFLVPDADPEPILRRGFEVDGEVARARVYSSALGVYELRLNGERVGDHHLAPGWTDYRQRIQYQTHDVTDLLQPGENALGALLGDGWYAGHLGFFGAAHYGTRPHLFAELHVDYTDGSSEVVTTDDAWRSTHGPITGSDLLMGEHHDARLEPEGWDEPGFDDADWTPVAVDGTNRSDRLVAQVDPPVRVIEDLTPVEVTEPEPGRFVYDLGQNMVGHVRIEVEGDAGDTVTLRHAEILDPDGMLYVENLRTADATDSYTLRGDGVEVYEPRFTFHGFRYLEITGIDEALDLDVVTGRVVHSDAPLTSELETSSELVDQLHRNITWGQRGNFLSIPTDTPARDERMGWTGDINVFVSTAAFNMDVRAFLDKYLADMRDAQDPDGSIPDVAPDIDVGRGHLATGVAGWADAAVTVPWTLWQRYGDTQVIDDNYRMMADWIAYMEDTSDGLIRPNVGYGDHVNLDDTDRSLLGTAYFARSATLLAEMADATGRDDDATTYRQLADDVTGAFVAEYVDDDGTILGDTQTAYALALAFDLVPDDLVGDAVDHLVADIADRDGHISTGFLGTEHLLPVLEEHGELDVAHQLLLNETYPSWGYQIDLGATTMWERWDSYRPEEGFQSAGMNSFNHFPFGSVGDFLYRTVAGIEAAEPGYDVVRIRPQPGELEHARGSYDSVHGAISNDWHVDDDGEFHLDVTLPANTTGEVHVPAASPWAVTEGGVLADGAEAVRVDRVEDGEVVLAIGSGSYRFATDRVLGEVGDARAAALDLRASIDDLEADGRLARGEATHLRARATQIADQLDAGMRARLDDDGASAVAALQQALRIADQLERWLQARERRFDPAVHARLRSEIEVLVQRASVGAVGVLDVRAELVVDDVVAAGDTVRVGAEVASRGNARLTDLGLALDLPDGWTASPVGDSRIPDLPAGRTDTIAVDVTVPADHEPATVSLTGELTFRTAGAPARLPLGTEVEVVSPLEVVDLVADPDVVDGPEASTTVTATVRNRAATATDGTLTFELPDGWSADATVRDLSLQPGEEVAFDAAVTTAGDGRGGEVTAVARYADVVGDTASTHIAVELAAWRFEDDGDTQGWAPLNQLTDVVVADGVLSAVSTGGDPWFVYQGDLGQDLEHGIVVEIVMEPSTSSDAEVFYGTSEAPGFAGGRSVRFPVSGGEVRTYRAQLPASDAMLTDLRFDPLETDGPVEIHQIRLLG